MLLLHATTLVWQLKAQAILCSKASDCFSNGQVCQNGTCVSPMEAAKSFFTPVNIAIFVACVVTFCCGPVLMCYFFKCCCCKHRKKKARKPTNETMQQQLNGGSSELSQSYTAYQASVPFYSVKVHESIELQETYPHQTPCKNKEAYSNNYHTYPDNYDPNLPYGNEYNTDVSVAKNDNSNSFRAMEIDSTRINRSSTAYEKNSHPYQLRTYVANDSQITNSKKPIPSYNTEILPSVVQVMNKEIGPIVSNSAHPPKSGGFFAFWDNQGRFHQGYTEILPNLAPKIYGGVFDDNGFFHFGNIGDYEPVKVEPDMMAGAKVSPKLNECFIMNSIKPDILSDAPKQSGPASASEESKNSAGNLGRSYFGNSTIMIRNSELRSSQYNSPEISRLVTGSFDLTGSHDNDDLKN